MKDAHFSSGRRALLAAARARRALDGGVTTLRDLGSTDGIALALKEAVELGQVEGSRIVSCGAAVVMTGGHGYQHGKYEADGPDEIRAAIRQNLKDGADLIKICQSEGLPYPEYTMEELEAVVHECHMRGKKVACHVETEPGLGMAVRAGIDTIEHGFNPDDETLELMAEKGTYWVPTITINRRMRQEEHDEESYVEGVRRAFLQKGMQGPEVDRKLDFLRNCFAAFPERFERGLELGVKIVAGSDGPRPKGYAGERGIPMEAVRNELVKFVQWGMKPMDAILAGTALAAEALGRQDRLGCVKSGYVADLVAVDGNPLEDIEDIDNISFVMKEGQPV
jgi:imidazolonepropionase-like amidohydrolase